MFKDVFGWSYNLHRCKEHSTWSRDAENPYEGMSETCLAPPKPIDLCYAKKIKDWVDKMQEVSIAYT